MAFVTSNGFMGVRFTRKEFDRQRLCSENGHSIRGDGRYISTRNSTCPVASSYPT